MNRMFIYVMILFLLIPLTGCRKNAIFQGTPLYPEQQESSEIQALLDAHNKERRAHGARDLQLDDTLNEFAQKRSEINARRGSLVHSSLGPLMGKFHTAGENIAYGQRSVKEVVNGWMHSPGHRSNILKRDYTKVGFGIARKNGTIYWTATFGG